MQVKVSVDASKCQEAYQCHLCVKACPRGSLSLVPTIPARRVVETNSKFYTVEGRHLADCTGCMECVRLCPEKAIAVSFN